MALVGAEVKRKEDPRLVTGTSSYVSDIAMPGLHCAAFVRSPHAHARIRRIDTTTAAKRPGVRMILTGEDIRAYCAPVPPGTGGAEGGGATTENLGRRHFPLSIGRVRHVGEAVAVVLADSEAVAVDAAAEVDVDWEPLPALADPFEAMAAGAPQLFDHAANNIEHVKDVKAGDPDAAFARAHRVVKQRMVSQRLAGIPLEPRAVLAAPDPLTGGIVVWDTHQAPHALRNDIATALKMSQSMVRVIAPEVGGGFGV